MASARHDPWKSILYYGVRWPVTIWVSFFRGTPLFVQIFLMYFAVLPIFIHPVDGLIISGSLARELRGSYGALIAGFLAISLNAGAYMSEVFRAGIQSLDKGQSEAARSVGMSYWQCMRHIILPQAFRRMLPAARTVAGASARYWEPYLTISIMYWVMTLGLAWLIRLLEQRLGKGDDK